MKKRVIIIISVLVVILLAARGIYKSVTKIDDEKEWYVSQLKINCSFRVDTVFTYGLAQHMIICRLVSGEIDETVEKSINKKLRHHKRIRLLTKRRDGRYLIFFHGKVNYQYGDSLHIDTNRNELVFFRGDSSTWKTKASNALNDIVF